MIRNFLYTGLVLLVAGNLAASDATAKESARSGAKNYSISKSLPKSNVTLRSAILVEDGIIRLGDLFENAGEYADAEIAYAPQPGKRAVFDARWLYRVARAYKLSWRPLSLKTRAVVERTSQEINRDEIEDHMVAALRDYGLKGEIDVELSHRSLQVFVAANQSTSIGIEGLSVNQSTGRFNATLVTSIGSPDSRRIRLTGRVHKMQSLPVLSKQLSRRDIIRKHHIEWRNVRTRKIRQGTITDANELIGMAAKRLIRAGEPVRTNQIQRPQLVTKGSIVTIFLKIANMNLTAQGRAMENGSKGDVIRIVNSQSKKVVEAKVTGANSVRVNLARQIALN